jgi:hypothetical protein
MQEMPDELLVYDLDTNKAHCLNQTSAFVWKACNGKNSVSDISKLFGNNAGNAVPEDLVWLAIDQLSQNNLLENRVSVKLNGQTRREIIKKVGLASVVALPLVASLVAPSAVLAGITGACTGTCPSAGSTETRTCPDTCQCISGVCQS